MGCGLSVPSQHQPDGAPHSDTHPDALQSRCQPICQPTAKTASSQPLEDGKKYADLSALRCFLESGDVALIRASSLLATAQRKGIFLRRQELPPEALVDSIMLERSFAELHAWDAYLAERPADESWQQQLARFPPFVVISYAWTAREHPDGDGRQLREVLAPALQWYMSERAQLIRGGFQDIPGSHIPNSFDSDGCDFCVFLDYSSMYQHSPKSHECTDCKASEQGPCQLHRRSAEEEDAFKRALGSMDLLYAHQRTCVWRLTRQLEGHSGLEYSQRGWPFFETTVSWLIKLGPNCLNLGTEQAKEALARFEGRMRTAGDLVEQASYRGHRTMGTQGALLDARRPPILPDDFEHQMQAKTLTNGKDRAVVVDLQRAVTTTVLRSVELLDFSSLGWGDADAQQLSKALPWCCALTDLRRACPCFSI